MILEAHKRASKENKWDFKDDGSMILHYGLGEVVAIPGETTNIKITYPEDLAIAEGILKFFK